MFQQHFQKVIPLDSPGSMPYSLGSEALDLAQMVKDIRKQQKSTYFIIPNNFCFYNYLKKSVPGDVRVQVLQEPVGASHTDQGWKSEMPHP